MFLQGQGTAHRQYMVAHSYEGGVAERNDGEGVVFNVFNLDDRDIGVWVASYELGIVFFFVGKGALKFFGMPRYVVLKNQLVEPKLAEFSLQG